MYKVLDAWSAFGAKHDRKLGSMPSMAMDWQRSQRKSFDSEKLEEQSRYYCFDRHQKRLVKTMKNYMLNPNAKKALLWEIMAFLFIGRDVIAIPFNVFNPEDTWFTISMRTIVQCFWTVDVILKFFIGYTSVEGTIILNPAQVAKKYLRSRFFLDIILASCAWVGGFVDDDTLQVITGINIFQLVQLLRVHRLGDLSRLGDKMFLYIQSEEKLIVAYISMIICLVLGIVHLIACMWYLVSDADFILPAATVAEAYTQCIHIALALLVGEHVITQYGTMQQRVFTVAILFFGLILCAAFVGALTTALTHLQNVSRKRSGLFAALHRFLTEHNVSAELRIRLNRNALFTFNQQKLHIQEKDVEILGNVSEALKAELHYEIHSPRVMAHPFLQVFNRLQMRAIQNLCDTAVMPLNVSRGDILFTVLELPQRPAMYFCKGGSVHYFVAEFRGSMRNANSRCATCVNCGNTFMDDSFFCRKCGARREGTNSEDDSSPRFRSISIKEERCLAEASLWTTWTHCGTAKAAKESQLLSLDAQRFGHIMRKVHLAHVWQYALRFMEYLNTTASPSDLGPDPHEWRTMVAGVCLDNDPEFESPPEWDLYGEKRQRKASLISAVSAHSQKSAISTPSLSLLPS
jgi:hypothetical protein